MPPSRRRFEESLPLTARRSRAWAGEHAHVLAAVALTLIVLGPLLRPGFVLTYDMVFVPHPRLSLDLLGLGRNLPRDVPFSFLLALSARLLPGEVVQKLVLLGVFGGAAWGAGRLVPGNAWGKVAGGVLYAWNPLTYERILLGQASFLLSFAALPWVAVSALRVRRGQRHSVAGLVLSLSVAAFASPYGGAFAAVVALAVAASPPKAPLERPIRALLITATTGLVLNLPWVVPTLLRAGRLPAPPIGFDLFRSRSDSPLGLAGSLLSLGGAWRTDLAPPGRNTLAWVPAFIVVAGIAVFGCRTLIERWRTGAVAGLVAVAAIGFALSLGVSAPIFGNAVRWFGVHGPGGAALRDGQKFMAPFALLLAVAFGAGVARLAESVGASRSRAALALALAVMPIALAPTLAWGASGRLFVSSYPRAWSEAQDAMAKDPAPGAILVLPWHRYLPFSWNSGQVVMQPAHSFFSREVVESDSLEVGHAVVPPEDPWSRLADPIARADGGALAPDLPGLGVRYVLVLKEADWRFYADRGRLEGLELVLQSGDLDLYRSPFPAAPPSFPQPLAGPVIGGDIAAGGAFAWAMAWMAIRRVRGKQSGAPEGATAILAAAGGGEE